MRGEGVGEKQKEEGAHRRVTFAPQERYGRKKKKKSSYVAEKKTKKKERCVAALIISLKKKKRRSTRTSTKAHAIPHSRTHQHLRCTAYGALGRSAEEGKGVAA